MMKTRDVSRGALVNLAVNGEMSRMYICDIKDGQVTFRKSKNSKRGGWWLPYEFVVQHGTLVSPGEAGRRPGDRYYPK